MTEPAPQIQAAIDLVLNEICSNWSEGEIESRRAYVAECLAKTGSSTLIELRHTAHNVVAELMALENLERKRR